MFPDTNIFIQCKPLHELNWLEWKEYDEVCLIVSRPVQAEIDKQKGGGNTRLAKRSRATSSMFRDILLSEKKYREIRSSKPTVRLYLRQDIKPDESLSNQLVYRERDDQLVGITSSFAKSHGRNQVFLLTLDTGPMTSAHMVGVKFIPIPDEWLMTPETNESEKKIKKLQDEIDQLKRTEPIIDISFENSTTDGTALNQIVRTVFKPLTDEEISRLVRKIIRCIPIETNFGLKEPEQENGSEVVYQFASLIGKIRKFVPATDEQILAYKNDKYPNWVEECKKYLQCCHRYFNHLFTPPRVLISLTNTGTRPAKDSLVTFSARGDFCISPPPYKHTDTEDTFPPQLSLPQPPKPPKGEWKTINLLDQLTAPKNPHPDYSRSASRLKDIASIIPNDKKDPNIFYYQNHTESPVECFSLECEQWRHKTDSEEFLIDLYFKLSPGIISGFLEVKIHAENIATPISECKSIRIKIDESSVIEKAESLVETLITEYHCRIL